MKNKTVRWLSYGEDDHKILSTRKKQLQQIVILINLTVFQYEREIFGILFPSKKHLSFFVKTSSMFHITFYTSESGQLFWSAIVESFAVSNISVCSYHLEFFSLCIHLFARELYTAEQLLALKCVLCTFALLLLQFQCREGARAASSEPVGAQRL